MAVRLIETEQLGLKEKQKLIEVLCKNGIHYYETPPAKWGRPTGAIWLREASQLRKAQGVLSEYYNGNYISPGSKKTRLPKIMIFFFSFIITVIIFIYILI